MGTFKRKNTVSKKLGSDDLRIHTGIRLKKTSARPKPSSWFQRLIGVVFNKGKKDLFLYACEYYLKNVIISLTIFDEYFQISRYSLLKLHLPFHNLFLNN